MRGSRNWRAGLTTAVPRRPSTAQKSCMPSTRASRNSPSTWKPVLKRPRQVPTSPISRRGWRTFPRGSNAPAGKLPASIPTSSAISNRRSRNCRSIWHSRRRPARIRGHRAAARRHRALAGRKPRFHPGSGAAGCRERSPLVRRLEVRRRRRIGACRRPEVARRPHPALRRTQHQDVRGHPRHAAQDRRPAGLAGGPPPGGLRRARATGRAGPEDGAARRAVDRARRRHAHGADMPVPPQPSANARRCCGRRARRPKPPPRPP